VIPTPNFDFIVRLNYVSGLGGATVEQNKTRVTKLLRNGTTRAKSADLEKEIEAHETDDK